jgi:hypothetical protein
VTPRRWALLAVTVLALVACTPAVGFTPPFQGEARYQPSSGNFEGHMVACTADGGPVTVTLGEWGFDRVHPFRVDVTDAAGGAVATLTVDGSDDVLVTQPLPRGTCFAVAITSPGTTGRSYYTYTVNW